MKKFYLLLAMVMLFAMQAYAGDTARFTTEIHLSTTTVVFSNNSTLDGSFDRKAWWSFGDGSILQTTPLAGAEHHYQSPGTYHVCLRLYSYTSTTDSVLRSESCKDVTIETVCAARYEYHDSISYSPFSHTLAFTAIPFNNANKAVTRVCWDFGDGTSQCVEASAGSTSATLLKIKHQYPLSTLPLVTYNACVTITYDGGCQSKDCHNIYLQTPGTTDCQTNFTAGLLSSNALGRTFSVTTSTVANPKPVKVCWNFGDGSGIQCQTYAGTYTGSYSTYHIFPHTGTFEVCAVVNYANGCEAKKCQAVSVAGGDATCTADFQIINTPVNPRLKYFNPVVGNSLQKKPISVCWNFGDGSAEQCHTYSGTYTGTYATSHIYDRSGQYEVCVTIKYDGGCQARRCQVASVIAGDATCTADFQVLNTLTNPRLKYFNPVLSNSQQNKPISVCWNFGDGSTEKCFTYAGTYTGTYATSHTYERTGQFEVCVTIRYDGGCQARKCQVVSVIAGDATCTADFQVLNSTSVTTGRYFSAIINNSLQKKPVKVCWKFGDGTPESCQTFSTTYTGSYAIFHTYAHAGEYEACITITYDGGCEAKKCKVVNVQAPTCPANFQVITAASSANLKYFNVLLADSIHLKPLQVCWKFGDGTADVCHTYAGTYTGSYATSHQYANAGEYEACVTIKYDGGCEAKKCMVVSVLPASNTCEAKVYEASASLTTLERKYYAFLQTNRTADSICWNFGDGSARTCVKLSNPVDQQSLIATHNFPAPGNYRVCIRVVYSGGCVAERCLEVTVRPQSTSTCGGYLTQQLTTVGSVLFNGFSIHDPNDNPVQFNWTFGDGATGTGQQVNHTYTGTGPFRVCLSIRTTSGCETNVCTNVITASNAQPKLVLNPNPVAGTLHVTFISTRSETISIRIFNANGILLRTYTRTVAAGNNTWDVDVSNLPTGVYSMVIQSANQFATAIFFKQ